MANKRASEAIYRKIYTVLRKEVLDGIYQPGEYLPSERELCERFQVERITVRKALELLVEDNLVVKHPGIGTCVRERPGYLASEESCRNIMFVLPISKSGIDRITDVFNAELFYRLEKECRSQDYTLIYTSASEQASLSEITNGNSICGIIFVSQVQPRVIEECHMAHLPCILVNNYHGGITSVISDNLVGTREVVDYLYEKGHTEIGMITGLPEYFNSQERLLGFRERMAQHHLSVRKEWVQTGNWNFDGGVQAMEAIFESGSLPTAIFAANDMTALGAIDCIRRHGLSVPEDISVIGFDNISQCKYSYPPLTSVDVDTRVITLAVCDHLISEIETAKSLQYRIVIPVRIVERESVRNIKK